MAAPTIVPLTKKSQESFKAYYDSLQNMQNRNRNQKRAKYERTDRAYQREVDATYEQAAAKAANAAGDTSKYQNMVIPVVMPAVETAVTYQTSVFLTGQPIFGVVSSPAFMTEALQMQTILENQSLKGGWARELMMFFRDGFKYNFAPIEVSWRDEVSYAVGTDLQKNTKTGQPKEVIWSGNKIRRLDPYNTFVDTSVAPSEVHSKGEYAGFTEYMSRMQLKSFIASLPEHIVANVAPAFASASGASGGASAGAPNFYVPQINPEVNVDDQRGDGMNWMKWASLSSTRNPNMDYKDGYEVTTLYCRILPAEFELRVPSSNTPQIYKLVIVNHEHIIYAELQTNAHNNLGILVGQPYEDGLAYQTKALADNTRPFQELATTYMDSIIASRRRAISDRVLYDPSRITSAAINSANPSAKIPVRPAAYGKNIGEAVYAFPYREDQSASSMQQIGTLLDFSNQLSGQNKVSQGQFQKGNKTLQEFQDTMSNANGRDQLTSILLEFQVFIPMKEMLKLNILQFQGGTELYNRDQNQVVEVDPIALRKAVLDFKISDGLIPSSKLINGESFSTALQVIGSSSEIANGYNIAPLFSYLMKTQGADLTDFEKSPAQSAYEQAMGAWQQMMQFAIEKGMDPEAAKQDLPAQPLPADYGYNPKEQTPAPSQQDQSDPAAPSQGI
jgi:hypothetical protein